MGCSQNVEPVLVIDYITEPNISGYQNGTLILGTIHMALTLMPSFFSSVFIALRKVGCLLMLSVVEDSLVLRLYAELHNQTSTLELVTFERPLFRSLELKN